MSEKKDQPTDQQAVALNYNAGQGAPTVVAKGQGMVAERIIELAEAAGVPLYEDAELVKLLARLDLEEEIPVQLYKAVAEVLAFVYRLNGTPRHVQDATKGQ